MTDSRSLEINQSRLEQEDEGLQEEVSEKTSGIDGLSHISEP